VDCNVGKVGGEQGMGLRQRVQRKEEVARTIQRLMTSFMLEMVAIFRVISATGMLLKQGDHCKT